MTRALTQKSVASDLIFTRYVNAICNEGIRGLACFSAYLGSAYRLYGSFISRALYLRGEISGVRLYERFVQLGGCHTHRFLVSSSLWYGRLVTEPVLRVEMAFLVLVTGKNAG
jgi:hypothetical protein